MCPPVGVSPIFYFFLLGPERGKGESEAPRGGDRFFFENPMGGGGTNFRGWRRVWGEPGENRGGTGGAQKNRGRTAGIWEENRGRTGAFGINLQRVPGEKRGLWDKNRGRTGGREFSLKQETQLGT